MGVAPSLAVLASSAVVTQDLTIPASLEPALRRACAGAWRALEIVVAAPVMRAQLRHPSFMQLRPYVEPLLGVGAVGGVGALGGLGALGGVDAAAHSGPEGLARIRDARQSDLFDRPLDMPVVFGGFGPDHVRRDLASAGIALDDASVALVVEAVRAVGRRIALAERELAPWFPGPNGSPYEAASAAFAELYCSAAGVELDPLFAAAMASAAPPVAPMQMAPTAPVKPPPAGAMVCARCGKENQDHFKFCLGCGGELGADSAQRSRDMVMMKTLMTASSEELVAVPPPLRCPSCGNDVPPGFRFCGTCGHNMEAAPAPPAPPPPAPQPRRRFTLILPDGSEGASYDLHPGDNDLGRTTGVFPDDPHLSPSHASIVVDTSGGSAVVRDLASANGVYVHLTTEHELVAGQMIRIGRQILRFDVLPPPEPPADDTLFLGSAVPGLWATLTSIIPGGTAAAYPLVADRCALGRARGDVNFPDDGYMSGLHARVERRDGRTFVVDLGSSNGTFVRIASEHVVGNGAMILLGAQLIRLDLL